MIVGKRLKELRKGKGLTQKELGKLVNVTKVSVCCYENGVRTPNLETFEDLINVLDVTADYLLGNDIKVKTIKENEEKYSIYVSKEDIDILNEIKLHSKLYKKLINNPKRMVEFIDNKLK